MTPDMKLIQRNIDIIVEDTPDLAPYAASCLAATKASWERALLQEKRISKAARHNIASYLMSFVGTAFGEGCLEGQSAAAAAALVRHATSIDGTPMDRHNSSSGYVPHEGWQGSPTGPWTLKLDSGHSLCLMYTLNMPGGKWTIAIDTVPCLYGDDPEDIERRTRKMLDLLLNIDFVRPMPKIRRPFG